MFHKYHYAYALYREGSFTKAAEKLFISQPSLSTAIKNIEQEVGAVLFERSGSGVTLTEAGRAYIAAVEQVIQLEHDLQSKLRDLNALESGHLTVGGSNYLSSYVLPRIINVFTTRYPKIQVDLAEANSHHLLEMLRQDQVDIIIDNYDNRDACTAYPLVQEQILLCIPKNNPLNSTLTAYRLHPDSLYSGTADLSSVPPVPMDRFWTEKFILLKPGNDMHDRAMHIFEQNRMSPPVVFYVDQLNIAYALAASGNGLTFVTDTFFKYGRFREDVWLYRMDPSCSRTLFIAHRRNKYCSKAMTEFIRAAGEVVC